MVSKNTKQKKRNAIKFGSDHVDPIGKPMNSFGSAPKTRPLIPVEVAEQVLNHLKKHKGKHHPTVPLTTKVTKPRFPQGTATQWPNPPIESVSKAAEVTVADKPLSETSETEFTSRNGKLTADRNLLAEWPATTEIKLMEAPIVANDASPPILSAVDEAVATNVDAEDTANAEVTVVLATEATAETAPFEATPAVQQKFAVAWLAETPPAAEAEEVTPASAAEVTVPAIVAETIGPASAETIVQETTAAVVATPTTGTALAVVAKKPFSLVRVDRKLSASKARHKLTGQKMWDGMAAMFAAALSVGQKAIYNGRNVTRFRRWFPKDNADTQMKIYVIDDDLNGFELSPTDKVIVKKSELRRVA